MNNSSFYHAFYKSAWIKNKVNVTMIYFHKGKVCLFNGDVQDELEELFKKENLYARPLINLAIENRWIYL